MFRSDENRKFSEPLIVFVITIAAAITFYRLLGHIPVGGGAGWDGNVYLGYAISLINGDGISGDPYRAIRMSGFLPLIALGKLGLEFHDPLAVQMWINICLLATAAASFNSALANLQVVRAARITTTVTLICSWPFIVMPVYYPILSDHAALALTCFALWAWSKGYQKTLGACAAIFVWIIPSLFIGVFVLACTKSVDALRSDGFVASGKKSVVMMSLAGIAALMAYYILSSTSITEVASHTADGAVLSSVPQLIMLSACAAASIVFAIVCYYYRILISGMAWRALHLPGLAWASALMAISLLCMYSFMDWSHGFKGPPLLHFMMLQTLAAPYKPIIAHIVSFGPLVIMAFLALAKASAGRSAFDYPQLVLALSAYLVLLAFGSESRQWIGALPLMAAVVATSSYTISQRLWGVIVGATMIASSLYMPNAVNTAFYAQQGIQSNGWQHYFGRQGPWMSVDVYQMGIIASVAFTLVLVVLSKRGPD